MDFIRIPFGYVIEFCYKLIPSYAVALLFFALIVKIVLFPLGIKQQKNQVKQAKLQPKVAAIRKRYAGRTDRVTQQKIQQETMDLYQKEGFNPASGCLPMIISLVLVMVVYNVMLNPLRYVNHVSQENMSKINEKIYEIYVPENGDSTALESTGLSTQLVDKIKAKKAALTGIEVVNVLRVSDISQFSEYLPEGFEKEDLPNFSVFGIDLSGQPAISNISLLWIIPVLTFVFTFGSMKLTKKLTYQPPQQEGDAAVSMKFMDFTMPLISTFICFSVPAIVAVYWIYQNVFSVLQQLVLKLMYPCPTYTEEELKEIEREMNKGIKIEKKSKKSGKIAAHRIDLEEPEIKEDDKEEASAAKPVKEGEGLIAPAALKDEKDKK